MSFVIFYDFVPTNLLSLPVTGPQLRTSTDKRAGMKLRFMIALMMKAARTSETSVDIQLRTRQNIPEDSELHSRRRENLKSHKRAGVCTCAVQQLSLRDRSERTT
jgi:hypothetical protein